MMEPQAVIRETWLSRKILPYASELTFILSALLLFSSLVFWSEIFPARDWMAANGAKVFSQHQYWKAWTTLFAHGDWGHLVSNAMLFIPLTYLLAGHFGYGFFPLVGLFVGGLVNLLVLKVMPLETYLIGISGVVYWMGAAWLTLYILIDRRVKLRRRLAISLFLVLMLFVPDSYKQDVSYLSHALGFVAGVISALTYYFTQRQKILDAEIIEYVYDEPEFQQEIVHENEKQHHDGKCSAVCG